SQKKNSNNNKKVNNNINNNTTNINSSIKEDAPVFIQRFVKEEIKLAPSVYIEAQKQAIKKPIAKDDIKILPWNEAMNYNTNTLNINGKSINSNEIIEILTSIINKDINNIIHYKEFTCMLLNNSKQSPVRYEDLDY